MVILSFFCFALLGTAAAQFQNACSGGGTMVSQSTTLRLPASTGNFYPANLRCTWTLSIPANKAVKLTFSFIDVDSDDFVRVYSGNRLILSVAGNEEPDPTDVQENFSRITFTSGSSASGYGFKLHILYIPRDMTVTPPTPWTDSACSSSRSISSSQTLQYPGNVAFYAQNLRCTWDVGVRTGGMVAVLVEHLDTVRSQDYLRVYNGNRQLVSMSGNTEPDRTFSLTSRNSKLTFNSDSRNGKSRGFRVRITFHDTPATVFPQRQTTQAPSVLPGACGNPETVNANKDVSIIGYPSNTYCLWWIYVRDQDVHVQINSFTTGLDRDYLNVYNGPRRIARLTGSRSSVNYVLNARNAWSKIEFRSSSQANLAQSRNQIRFSVNFGGSGTTPGPVGSGTTPGPVGSGTTPGPVDACRPAGTQISYSTTIVFPSSGGRYPANSVCNWHFIIPSTREVRLRFIFLDTETNRDYVYVYDGNNRIVTVSGSQAPTQTFTLQQLGSRIYFTSNSENSGSGFRVTVAFSPRTLPGHLLTTAFPLADCPGNQRIDGTTIIRHPSRGGSYRDNDNCRWSINVPSSKIVSVRITRLDTESGYDYLTILEGSQQKVRVSGSNAPSDTYYLRSPSTIIFTADRSQTRSGFSVSVNFQELGQSTRMPTLDCGRNADYAYGGMISDENQWPWVVAIYLVGGHFKSLQPLCGGVVIDHFHVLTAGHCIKTSDLSQYNLVFGEYNYNEPESGEVMMVPVRIVRPKTPGYIADARGRNVGLSDIALIQLGQSLTFSRHIHPICLGHEQITVQQGMEVIFAGWGRGVSTRGTMLQHVSLTVLDRSECDSFTISDEFCTYDSNKGVCEGDSGTPGVIKRNGRYHLVGLVSKGMDSRCNIGPTTHTDVTKLQSWIEFAIGKSTSGTTGFP